MGYSGPTGKQPNCYFLHTSNDIGTWVIDTGATSHICHDFSLLSKPVKLEPTIPVSLLDGTLRHSTHKRTLRLCNNLILRDVLYIPKFSYNMISIKKLTQVSNTYISFYPNYCFVQDLTTNKKIKEGNNNRGLVHHD